MFNNKWWKNKYKYDNNDKQDINLYLTYQKTLIDERQINQIIMESYNLLNEQIRNKNKINIYYKYQQSLKNMIR